MTELQDNAGVASELRALVTTRSRPSELAILTDEQLIQVFSWLQAGQADETIGRAITDLWGRCTGCKRADLLDSIKALREKAFANTALITAQTKLIFDPIEQNAALIKALFAEWEKIKTDTLFPKKEELEHQDRLARLLSDTIANHGTLISKMQGKGNGSGEGEAAAPINVGQLNILYQRLKGDNMPDFITNVIGRLERSATRKTPRQPPAVDVKPSNVTNA
jgi:hypothetical protein